MKELDDLLNKSEQELRQAQANEAVAKNDYNRAKRITAQAQGKVNTLRTVMQVLRTGTSENQEGESA
jgi:hypothetical protein